MTDLQRISQLMKQDWNRRIRHDYRFWMSDGHRDDATMWTSGARDFEIICQGITDTSQKTILDIGCGVGRLLKPALSRFGRVIGIDVSEEAVSRAGRLLGEHSNLELLVGNGFDLADIADKSVDVIVSFAALVSMPCEVVAAYVREMYRVLKPDGVVRLQLYLGEEQLVCKNDTLHLRCYKRQNFIRAMERAGLLLEWSHELELPFQVSFKEMGIEAVIVSLRRGIFEIGSIQEVASTLLPGGESDNANQQSERDLEYWMSLTYAKDLAEDGMPDRAREALEYAASVSSCTTIDVRDLLEQIVKTIEQKETAGTALSQQISNNPTTEKKDTVYSKNLEVLAQISPLTYSQLKTLVVPTELYAVVQTAEGPSLCYGSQCLDHPEKPISAARNWAKRLLQEARFADSPHLCVFGFGLGYHLEALQEIYSGQISIIEPSIEAFSCALRERDVSNLLRKLKHISIGENAALDFLEDAELCVRPQSQVLHQEYAQRVKSQFYGIRGFSLLRPTFGILGPLQGGTLPMTAYSMRGFQTLNQRIKEYDVSGFAQGYHLVEKFLADKYRASAVQCHYLEMLSQIILESVNEKPVDILVCMAQAPLSGRVLMELRKKGIITVLWFVEDYLRFTYWKDLARYFDFVFTIQKGPCLDAIKAAGAGEVHYLPVACDPAIHTPVQLTEEERKRWGSPISFVGAGYHNRQQVFASFSELPFKIWGTEWPGCRPFDRLVQEEGRRLTPTEYVKIFNATDININLHSSTERDAVEPNGDFVNPRTLELAACGAFQLVDERTHLDQLLIPGKEVVTFRDVADLRQKISYYLEHPEERQKICEAARARVLREHTYAHRMKQMISIIYNSKFEQLKRKQDSNPWKRMIDRSRKFPELHKRCLDARERGEEAILDGLVADVVSGKGKLSETEQKLMFLYHVRKQIIRMTEEEKGGKGPR